MVKDLTYFAFLGVFTTQLAFANGTDPKKPIESQIDFSCGKHPRLKYADISRWDPVQECPLDNVPDGFKDIVDRLVIKVQDSVSQVKKARGSQCGALDNRLTESRSELNDAMEYSFVAGSGGTNSDQDSINKSTRQAGAVNGLVGTATDMLNRECIESIDARIVIQKMLGQVISLGGLFLGGWQGIGTAAGGQIFASLPLFRDDVDRALQQFQKYDEINERGSFLCLYRQMQKTSCLMFTAPGTTVIDGLDTSMETGPGRVTRDSLEKIEKDTPILLEDVKGLWGITQSSKPFTGIEDHFGSLDQFSDQGFRAFQSWCQKNEFKKFNDNTHPTSAVDALASLIQSCDLIAVDQWKIPSRKKMSHFVYQRYWDFKNLISYYLTLRDNKDSPFHYVINTWESYRYFLGVKSAVEDFTDPNEGNQARLNFRRLTNELGKTLAEDSFSSIFKNNKVDLTGKKAFHRTKKNSEEVKKRALKAMLDLCKTLDPTLTCLIPDTAYENKLQTRWKKRCVGQNSDLCKRPTDEILLIDDPDDLVYYRSLCGPRN